MTPELKADKLIEFVESIDPWGVYGSDELATEFTAECGELPCWRSMTITEARTAIRKRGKGGHVTGRGRVVFGHAVVAEIARKYAGKDCYAPAFGVGSDARRAIQALKQHFGIPGAAP